MIGYNLLYCILYFVVWANKAFLYKFKIDQVTAIYRGEVYGRGLHAKKKNTRHISNFFSYEYNITFDCQLKDGAVILLQLPHG